MSIVRPPPDDAAVNELARQLNKYLGGGEPPINLHEHARKILNAVDDAVYDHALATAPKCRPMGDVRDRRAYIERAATRLQEYANAAGVRLDWRIIAPHMWAIEPAMTRGEAVKLKDVDLDAVFVRWENFKAAVNNEEEQ